MQVLSGEYVLRFAVGAPLTEVRHVSAAWQILQEKATALLEFIGWIFSRSTHHCFLRYTQFHMSALICDFSLYYMTLSFWQCSHVLYAYKVVWSGSFHLRMHGTCIAHKAHNMLAINWLQVFLELFIIDYESHTNRFWAPCGRTWFHLILNNQLSCFFCVKICNFGS